MSQNNPLSAEDVEAAVDILQKLRETSQTYIVGHDYPISVSEHIFRGLSTALDAVATAKDIPREQLEMEDLFGIFLGLMPLSDIERKIVNIILVNKLSG